ncbi:MAG: polymerase alpha subunit, partial [Tardiphaga sp.]|nr:polymerase alpha subunit [Tardiphaga sp.]
RKEVMGARLILVEGTIQASEEGFVPLVASRLVDRSFELNDLSEGLSTERSLLPNKANRDEPLNGDRRDHPDAPAQQIRHPRDVRILPRSRDFH